MIEKIILTPLRRIESLGGDIFHGIKITDIGYCGFGEAYFSYINKGAVKAWKLHKSMTLNLVVPIGSVRFIFCEKSEKKQFREIVIGEENYSRITVPPGIVFGFQGLDGPSNLIMNVSNIVHDPEEMQRFSVEEIDFNWSRR